MTRPTALPPLSPRQSQIVAELQPLLRPIARQTARMFPGRPVDDFVGAGTDAAMGIAIRFDPDRGVPLGVFARKRLRGAMVDFALQERRNSLRSFKRLARTALAADADDDPRSIELDGPEPRVISVHALKGRAAALITATFGQPRDNAEDLYISKEAHAIGLAALGRALTALSEEERSLVHAFYRDGLTIDGAVARLNRNRSAVRRLHKHVIEKLAELLRREGVERAVVGEE